MKLSCVKWLGGSLAVAGLAFVPFAKFAASETARLVFSVIGCVLILSGCAVLAFGFRCPVCGSRLGLKYSRGLLGMSHCPDCGASLREDE